MNNIYDRVRKNIKEYRKIKGITQQELADLTGYSHGYIRSIESVKVAEGFSLETLENIANALDTTVSKLVDEKKDVK